MNVKLSIEDDKDLRNMIRDMVKGQVRNIIRGTIKKYVEEELERILEKEVQDEMVRTIKQTLSTALVKRETTKAFDRFVIEQLEVQLYEQALGLCRGKVFQTIKEEVMSKIKETDIKVQVGS